MAFVLSLLRKTFLLTTIAFGVYCMFVEIEDFKWTLEEIVYVGRTGTYDQQNPYIADLGPPQYVEGILVQARSYHNLVTGTVWMNGKIKTKLRIEKPFFNYPISVLNRVSTIKIVWDSDIRVFNFIVYGNDYIGQNPNRDSNCSSSQFYLIELNDRCVRSAQQAIERLTSLYLIKKG